MNLGERIIFTFYTFCIALMSIAAALLPLGIFDQWFSIYYFGGNDWIVSFIGIGFFIISVWFLLLGLRSKNSKAIIKATNMGEVRVSFHAIEGLALKAVNQINGIRDTKLSVSMENEHIIIDIKTLIMADINIPQTTVDIQNAVKDYVEKYTGINVKEIKVNISNIWEANKVRVE